MSTKCSKNINILEFRDYIWNHHEKCIQISTNMPSIGLVIPEIVFKFEEFSLVKINGRLQSVTTKAREAAPH